MVFIPSAALSLSHRTSTHPIITARHAAYECALPDLAVVHSYKHGSLFALKTNKGFAYDSAESQLHYRIGAFIKHIYLFIYLLLSRLKPFGFCNVNYIDRACIWGLFFFFWFVFLKLKKMNLENIQDPGVMMRK